MPWNVLLLAGATWKFDFFSKIHDAFNMPISQLRDTNMHEVVCQIFPVSGGWSLRLLRSSPLSSRWLCWRTRSNQLEATCRPVDHPVDGAVHGVQGLVGWFFHGFWAVVSNIFYFHHYCIWGRFPIWLIFSQMGWNHQPDLVFFVCLYPVWWLETPFLHLLLVNLMAVATGKVAFRFCCPIPEKRWMQCFRVAERRWQRWRKDFGGWAVSSWCSYIVFVWLEFEKERHMPTIHVLLSKSVICRNTLLWYVFKCSLHESILRGVNRLYNPTEGASQQ